MSTLPDGTTSAPGRFRLRVNLATPAGHVAAAVHRARGLEGAVPLQLVTRERDGGGLLDGAARLASAPEAQLFDVERDAPLPLRPHLVPSVLDEAFAALAPQTSPVAQGLSDRESAVAVQEELLDSLARAASTTDQVTYERACADYFRALEALDSMLGKERFLCHGEAPGLSDRWLFAVLVRHDVAYLPFYKMALKRLADFEHLPHYARDLFQRPGWSDLVRLPAIRQHYAWLDETLNPKRRVPTGGLVDLWSPHDRHARFGTLPPSDAGTEESQSQLGVHGAFVRKQSRHRARIEDTPGAGHPAQAGRYHLYVSNNCPWSHRASLAWSMLGLEGAVTRDVTYFRRDPERGWQFRPEEPGCTPDTVHGAKYVEQIYQREGSTERSVPVLFDKVADRIVSNESADIVRMFGTELRALGARDLDLYPEAHRAEIDQLNTWIFHRINNGAYKAGFSSAQDVHEEAADALFACLDALDRRLAERKFLCGDAVTEADLRLFPTIFRFDHVYYSRFLLNRRRITDYDNLARWRRDFFVLPGVKAASSLDHCKKGYFGRTGNGLVPVGPVISFTADT